MLLFESATPTDIGIILLNVRIIFVGAPKESYFSEAVAEYEKRLKAYCRIENVMVKDEKLSEKPSDSEVSAALDKEGERVLAALVPRSYKIALCVEGKELSSEKFAELIESAATSGDGTICFIIGGSFGLSDKVKKRADFRLSVSPMTFPHRMMGMILLEQVYRAFNIISGGKYHK